METRRLRVYTTTDGGVTWEGPRTGSLPQLAAGGGKLNVPMGGVLWQSAGKFDDKPFDNRFFLSADGGTTWTQYTFPIGELAPKNALKSIVGIVRDDSGRITLAITADGGDPSIYESTDDPMAWRLVGTMDPGFDVQLLSSTDWVGTSGPRSEIRSTVDAGEHWHTTATPMRFRETPAVRDPGRRLADLPLLVELIPASRPDVRRHDAGDDPLDDKRWRRDLDPDRPLIPKPSMPCSMEVPMRPIVRLLGVLAVPLLVVTACSAAPATPSTAVTPTPSAVTVASPTAIATATAAPTTVDPAANPSIEATFVVGEDGRRLALVCWGEGSPTVLLETGGDNIEEWSGSGVVRQLASRARVCTYDRAGTGASDPPPYERRDADDVVNDLKALFVAADLDGPYVLVGRSFGGMIVTHYAEVLPEDVAGVVVLDTPAPSATFTEQNEPELVWDYPGNTERLDVVGGFENRFAKDPPKVGAPVLVITPVPGESSAEDQRFWLQVSAESEQVVPSCSDSAGGACADAVVQFVNGLR